MKKNKGNLKLRCLILLLAVGMLVCVKGNVSAAAGTVTSPGTACKVGKYIYYAYEMSGVRMGIMRYDTKTGKKKEITGYTNKGNPTNGFSNISLKGKYIYATWDLEYGTSESKEYIYRINKVSGAKKKLAEGSKPVLVGKYIYYVTCKADSSYHWTYYIYRMSLNGSGKKKVYTSSSYISGLYSDGEKLYFSTGYENSDYLNTLDGEVISKSERNVVENESGETSAIIGNYRYYSVKTSGSVTKLYRENTKTGKKQLVAEFKSGIWNWRVCDDYVMIECLTGSYQKNNLKANVYCVSANGKKKKKLASWMPAE